MTAKQVFFFEVKFSDGSTHAVQVKAADHITAKDCIEASNVMSAKPIESRRCAADVPAKLTDPIDLLTKAGFPYAG